MTRNSIIATVAALIVSSQVAAANAAPIFAQLSPIPATYVEDLDYTVFANTGLGNVTSGVTSLAMATGCFASDYAGFVAGSIALIAEGSCTFDAKVASAIAAGAEGVLIYDDAVGPLPDVSLAGQVPKPVLFITNSLGLGFTTLVGETLQIAVTELVSPTAVPIPGTLSLLAGGLAGLLLFRQRAKA